jgi:hypothetical protein
LREREREGERERGGGREGEGEREREREGIGHKRRSMCETAGGAMNERTSGREGMQ